MKKQLFILFSFFAILTNCSASPSGVYKISGKVENTTGKTIYLEELAHTKITLIDSNKLDDNGKFTLSSNIQYPGLYRLRVGEEAAWIITLRPKDNVTFTADAKNFLTTKITNSKDNDKLQEVIKGIGVREYELKYIDVQLQQLVSQGAAEQDIEGLVQTRNEKLVDFKTFLNKKIDSCNNLIEAYYLLSTAMQGEKEIPENVSKKIAEYATKWKKEYPEASITRDLEALYNRDKAEKEAKANAANAEKNIAVGAEAPDFVLPDRNGASISLKQFRGKVVLIDFWASWCGPCRRENPNVVAAYTKYKDKGFTVLSVSQDNDRAKWLDAIQADGLVWDNHVSDLRGNREPSSKYSIQYIPSTFLIDRDGKIVARNLRGNALEMELEKLLK